MYENRRKPGRMGPFVEGYRSRLLSLGYTPGTVGGQLAVLGQVGRWMQIEGLEPAQLDEAHFERFLSSRRAEGHPRVPNLRSFVALLEYLRDEHVIPVVAVPPPTAFEELGRSYDRGDVRNPRVYGVLGGVVLSTSVRSVWGSR